MRIAPHIYATRCPFGTAWIQVVLIVGDKAALIDSGVAPAFPQVLGLLAEAGIAPEQLGYIVNSHAHWDHVGGNALLAARTGATIAAHPAGQSWIEDSQRQFREFLGAYPKIVPIVPERVEFYREMMGPDHRVSLFLQQGDRLDLGAGIGLEVLETPGHLSSCLSLWEPESRTLFTGDTVNGHGPFGGIAQYDDVAAYRDSLAALLALKPVRLVPAHFEPQSGEQAMSFLQASFDQVAVQERAVLEAVNAPAPLGEIVRRVSSNLGVPLTVQVVITVEAHLKHLMAHGQVFFQDGAYTTI